MLTSTSKFKDEVDIRTQSSEENKEPLVASFMPQQSSVVVVMNMSNHQNANEFSMAFSTTQGN